LIAQNRIYVIELRYKQYFFEGWQAPEGRSPLGEMRVRLLDAKDGVGLLVSFCPYLLDFCLLRVAEFNIWLYVAPL